jgi:hypothetical protein
MYIHEIRDQPCAHNPERPAIPLVIAFVAVWVVMQGQIAHKVVRVHFDPPTT